MVARTHSPTSATTTCYSSPYHLLAVSGDSLGLAIHRYPLLSPGSEALRVASLSRVSECVFSQDDKHLLVYNPWGLVVYSLTCL